MIRRPPRSTLSSSSAASDVYKRQVNRFKEKNCPKRFFIYGSYAFNKPVIWKYKNFEYHPHIVATKKRMLTSFHDSNYLLKSSNHAN